MISKKREQQIIEQVLNHCVPITDAEIRKYEIAHAGDRDKIPKRISVKEVMKRVKAGEAKRKKNPPPQNAEEWALFNSWRFRYAMEKANILADEREAAEPDEARGKKQVATLRKIAPKGGKATAHYTDLHFTLSFSQYREKQLDKSAWDASHSLTRKGQPLDRYKQGSAYKRLERMAAKEGVSVPEYYENL